VEVVIGSVQTGLDVADRAWTVLAINVLEHLPIAGGAHEVGRNSSGWYSAVSAADPALGNLRQRLSMSLA
jgi:hypothetical protein